MVDCPSVDGGTALFVACQGGYTNIVKELLNAGANVNAVMKDRATPLFIAAQNGHRTVVLMLLAAGSNVDDARYDGATSLWIASQMGHDHIVKILLQKGAYVDAVRNDGATALFKAAHKGHSAVVHELLKNRPNLGLLPVSFDSLKKSFNTSNYITEWRDSTALSGSFWPSSNRKGINSSRVRSDD